MVVVGVRVADTNDAEALDGATTPSTILPTLERYLHIDVDDLAVEVGDHLLETASLNGNGAPAPFPTSDDDPRVRVAFQSAQKKPAVLVDQREAAVAVKAQIQQEQPFPHPVPGTELGALVGAFVGELELLDRLLGEVVNQMEFGA